VNSGDSNRYAPFEAAAGDTKESVRTRVLAHYAYVLATKARPLIQRPPWNKPRPAQAPDAAAIPTVEKPATT